MDPEGRINGAATPLTAKLPSDPPPGLTSASSSPPSSQLEDQEADDLAELRRQNEEKLQGRFQSIYAKYGRDFGQASDEIDLVTGEVVVGNGHLKYMRHERDIGPPSLFRALNDQDTSDDQQEAPPASASNHKSIDSLISANAASWSKPGAFDQYFSDISKSHVDQLVQDAVAEHDDVDRPDSSFLQTFSQNIVEQVARLMHTLKSSEVDDLKAILPSVLEEQLLAKDKPARCAVGNTKSKSTRTQDEEKDEEPDREKESVRWEPSIWEDAEFDFSISRSASPMVDGDGLEPSAAKKGSSRKGIVRWSKEEDDWLISLKGSGTLTYREISRRFPNRSYRAVRQRFRSLLGRDPAIMSAAHGGAEHCPSLEQEAQDPAPESPNTSAAFSVNNEPEKSGPNRAHYSSRRPWTPADDELLRHLREKEKLTWSDAANYFPGRSADAVGWRYYFRLQKGAKIPVQQSDQSSETGAEDIMSKGLGAEVQPKLTDKPKNDLPASDPDALNMEIDSAHDSGCSFTGQDVGMADISVDIPNAAEVDMCGSSADASTGLGSRHNLDPGTGPDSKKRKRPSDNTKHGETHANDKRESTAQSSTSVQSVAIPIDPMLLQQHVHLSSGVPELQKEPTNEGSPLVEVSEKAWQDLSPLNELTPRSNKSVPEPWLQQQQNPMTVSPTTTPSRQLQWSLSDALALVQNQRAPARSAGPYMRAAEIHPHTMHDFDDGLGSEDELAQ